MASSTPVVRLVRCPKCQFLLVEVAEVPVYKCGGCDTILRAKYSSFNGITTTSLSDNDSENRGLMPEVIVQPVPSSSDNLDRITTGQGNSLIEQAEMSMHTSHAALQEEGSHSSPGGNPETHLVLSNNARRIKEENVSVDSGSVSAIGGSFGSDRYDLPSRLLHIRAMERDTTFGSEDFHSVDNWIRSETDNEGGSESSSEDPKPSDKPDCLEPDHVRILRKVDELRDELNGFLTKTVEGKTATKFSHMSRIPSPPVREANVPSSYVHKVDKLPCKEKKQMVKSYCRPVSGGAPFVICYKCWKLLQLPADFLVTRKRLHKLRCGDCSKVLVFSFRPRDRASPMTAGEARHPPSHADNNNGGPGWDPISYSDDYGVSFVQSQSSEGEPALHVSRNSSYSTEEGDVQEVRGSHLHHLMGYTSASDLLFQRRGVDGGYESTKHNTPPHFNRQNGTRNVNPTSMGIEAEEEPHKRLRSRRKGLALQGFLKKGVRELSHGLEAVKLKIHSNG